MRHVTQPGGTDEALQITMPLDQLCGACHEEQVTGSREAPFPHVSAGGGQCVTCHNPHTADGTGLLNEPQQGTVSLLP